MRFLLVFTLLLAAVCFAKEGDTHCHGRSMSLFMCAKVEIGETV